jgi:hypothetical protein
MLSMRKMGTSKVKKKNDHENEAIRNKENRRRKKKAGDTTGTKRWKKKLKITMTFI